MNRDPEIRHSRGDGRKYETEFERMRPPRYDDRMMNDNYVYDKGPPPQVSEYRTLCISNLNPKVPDSVVSQALYEEYAPFGDFNVKVVHQGDHRIAYVNFKFAEDARAAKHSRRPGNFVLFDMPVRVDSVIHNRRPNSDGFRDQYSGRGGHSPGSNQGNRKPYKDDREYYQDGPDSVRGEFKDHKFPYHLHHIAPEDDEMATRTLFVGNLDNNIGEDELRRVFSQFGLVEEVDIKFPTKQGYMGNAYAFVKMVNLDMAHRAKVEMSGKFIGKYQCKIGYGKVNATNCLWLGGLGPWATLEILEQEFDRFGAIRHIEWQQGKTYGYVLYDNADAAQAACTEMRGFAIGGPEHRLRVDFADEAHIGIDFGQLPPALTSSEANKLHGPPAVHDNSPRGPGYHEPRSEQPWKNDDRQRKDSWNSGDRVVKDVGVKRPEGFNGHGNKRPGQVSSEPGGRGDAPNTRGPEDFQRESVRHGSPPVKKRRSSVEPSSAACDQRIDRRSADRSMMEMGNAGHVDNILELSKCLPVVWNGAVVLKNSAFAARMHLVSGDVHLVDTLMRDPTTTEMSVLKITQRLRLDPPKLDEVGRRVLNSGQGGHAVLLAMPGSTEALEDAGSTNNVQQRALKNLVTYLRQKEAAGVISLPPNPGKDRDNIGVLHAFPPCNFANDFLTKRAPKLILDSSKEEFLVIVVIKGAALS